jgi:hypothetical protein
MKYVVLLQREREKKDYLQENNYKKCNIFFENTALRKQVKNFWQRKWIFISYHEESKNYRSRNERKKWASETRFWMAQK